MTRRQKHGVLGSGIAMWALLALLLVSPDAAVAAEAGPGTEFRKCRDQAWSDYNECLMRAPDSGSNRTACYIFWDLDNIGCDIDLLNPLRNLFR